MLPDEIPSQRPDHFRPDPGTQDRFDRGVLCQPSHHPLATRTLAESEIKTILGYMHWEDRRFDQKQV